MTFLPEETLTSLCSKNKTSRVPLGKKVNTFFTG